MRVKRRNRKSIKQLFSSIRQDILKGVRLKKTNGRTL